MQAKCRNKFTQRTSNKNMIKYVPFDHPKFNKSLLEDVDFLELNHKDIYSFASLKDINSCFQSSKVVYYHDRDYYLSQNMDNEVFKYCVSIYKDDYSDFYDSDVLMNKTRLEHLLENKIFDDNWEIFIFMSDDLNMYKHVYQIHIDNNIHPIAMISARKLATLKKDIAEWCVDNNIWRSSIYSNSGTYEKNGIKILLYIYTQRVFCSLNKYGIASIIILI